MLSAYLIKLSNLFKSKVVYNIFINDMSLYEYKRDIF